MLPGLKPLSPGDTLELTQAALRSMSLPDLKKLIVRLGLSAAKIASEAEAHTLISQQIVSVT